MTALCPAETITKLKATLAELRQTLEDVYYMEETSIEVQWVMEKSAERA